MAACGEVELCSRLIAAIEAGITGTGRLRPGVRLVPDHMVLEIFGASGFGYIAPEEACRLATWPPAALLAAAPRAWTACLVEAWQGAEETRQAWVGELPSQAGVSCDKPGSPIVRDERRHAELLSLARRSGECLVQIFKSSLHHCGQPAARHLNKMAAAVVGTLLQGCRSPLSGSLARLALRADHGVLQTLATDEALLGGLPLGHWSTVNVVPRAVWKAMYGFGDRVPLMMRAISAREFCLYRDLHHGVGDDDLDDDECDGEAGADTQGGSCSRLPHLGKVGRVPEKSCIGRISLRRSAVPRSSDPSSDPSQHAPTTPLPRSHLCHT
jgi:hypothetical protein